MIALYGHGFGSLGGTLAHAALWSTVGRFMWSAPVVVVVVVALCAAGFVLLGGRRG